MVGSQSLRSIRLAVRTLDLLSRNHRFKSDMLYQVCAAAWSDTLNLLGERNPHEIREGEEDWGNDLYDGFDPIPRKSILPAMQ